MLDLRYYSLSILFYALSFYHHNQRLHHHLYRRPIPQPQRILLLRRLHRIIRRKRLRTTQTINPPQQELHHPIRGRRRILRDHMPAQIHTNPRQPSLRMRRAKHPTRRQRAVAQLVVERHVEGVRRLGREA